LNRTADAMIVAATETVFPAPQRGRRGDIAGIGMEATEAMQRFWTTR